MSSLVKPDGGRRSSATGVAGERRSGRLARVKTWFKGGDAKTDADQTKQRKEQHKDQALKTRRASSGSRNFDKLRKDSRVGMLPRMP